MRERKNRKRRPSRGMKAEEKTGEGKKAKAKEKETETEKKQIHSSKQDFLFFSFAMTNTWPHDRWQAADLMTAWAHARTHSPHGKRRRQHHPHWTPTLRPPNCAVFCLIH